jgi:hypothetical protein
MIARTQPGGSPAVTSDHLIVLPTLSGARGLVGHVIAAMKPASRPKPRISWPCSFLMPLEMFRQAQGSTGANLAAGKTVALIGRQCVGDAPVGA